MMGGDVPEGSVAARNFAALAQNDRILGIRIEEQATKIGQQEQSIRTLQQEIAALKRQVATLLAMTAGRGPTEV